MFPLDEVHGGDTPDVFEITAVHIFPELAANLRLAAPLLPQDE